MCPRTGSAGWVADALYDSIPSFETSCNQLLPVTTVVCAFRSPRVCKWAVSMSPLCAYTCVPVHNRYITWLCIGHGSHTVAPALQTVGSANQQHLCQGGAVHMQGLWLRSLEGGGLCRVLQVYGPTLSVRLGSCRVMDHLPSGWCDVVALWHYAYIRAHDAEAAGSSVNTCSVVHAVLCCAQRGVGAHARLAIV